MTEACSSSRPHLFGRPRNDPKCEFCHATLGHCRARAARRLPISAQRSTENSGRTWNSNGGHSCRPQLGGKAMTQSRSP
eukprot:181120-Amphidinium_carterae.1